MIPAQRSIEHGHESETLSAIIRLFLTNIGYAPAANRIFRKRQTKAENVSVSLAFGNRSPRRYLKDRIRR